MTLGAIAELKVRDKNILNEPIMHMIPNKMMAERGRFIMMKREIK